MYNKEKNNLLSLLPCKFKGAYIAGGALTSVFTNNPIAVLDSDLGFERVERVPEPNYALYDNYADVILEKIGFNDPLKQAA